MKQKNVVNVLKKITQLDSDAVNIYEEALKRISESDIYEKMIDFMNDHIQHIEVISKELRKYHKKFDEKTALEENLIENTKALRSANGTKAALKIIENNEIIINKAYENILKNTEFPLELIQVIQKNYLYEKRHLGYIRLTLANLNKLEMDL